MDGGLGVCEELAEVHESIVVQHSLSLEVCTSDDIANSTKSRRLRESIQRAENLVSCDSTADSTWWGRWGRIQSNLSKRPSKEGTVYYLSARDILKPPKFPFVLEII